MSLDPVPCSDSKRRKLLGIEDLSDDLLLEIFYKLHGESAVRCKSVSKRWYSLISNPCFVHRSVYLNRHKSEHTVTFFIQNYKLLTDSKYNIQREYFGSVTVKSSDLLVEARYSKRSHVLDFGPCFNPNKFETICVLSSFNDLLLCCGTRKYQTVYYICNPSTKQYLELPPTPSRTPHDKVALICYPNNCTDDQYNYKVVRILVTDGWVRNFEVEIFCSKTGDWKCQLLEFLELPDRSIEICYSTSKSIVVHNEIFYWLNQSLFTKIKIIVFDPIKDGTKFSILDLPDDYVNLCVTEFGINDFNNMSRIEFLGVTKDRLRIMVLVNQNKLCVWELEDYDAGKWTKKRCCYLRRMIFEDPWLIEWTKRDNKQPKDRVELAAFDPFDGDIVYLFWQSRLVLCDMRKKTLKMIGKLQHADHDVGGLSRPHIFRIAHPWWPTAVPPLTESVGFMSNEKEKH